jgi:iron(III) transport system substrate-binding protein
MNKLGVSLLLMLMTPGALAQTAIPQKSWEQVLAAAKQEGKLVVVGSPDPVMRKEVIPAFTARYGIQVAYIAGGSSEIVGRVRLERSSGIYAIDVYLSGNDTTVNVLYREKMIDPIRPLMILPETIDPAKWKAGKLRFVDPDEQYILRMFSTVTDVLFINADLIDPAEMRSAQDLLNPKWKGKISGEDPTVPGSGANAAGRFINDLGADYLKKLYIDQQPLITRDRRLLSDALARGTHPICLNCRPDDLRELLKSGFKLLELFDLQGVPPRVRPGPFLMTVANKRPNPNAAQVFVNWMAGKEALEIYSRNYEEVTLRTDVDESFLDPRIIPKPGVNYPDEGDFDWIKAGRKQAAEKAQALLKR